MTSTKKPRRVVTEEMATAFADLREKGQTFGQIALRYDVSPGVVSWHCLRLGADRPDLAAQPLPAQSPGPRVVQRGDHQIRRFTAEEDAKLRAMAKNGARLSDIATALNRRVNSIKGRLMTLARHDARRENVAA